MAYSFSPVASVGWVALMSRPYNLTYGFSSDALGLIEWRWNASAGDKIFHQTWKPKQADIKILTKGIQATDLKQLKLEIMIDLQPELKRI